MTTTASSSNGHPHSAAAPGVPYAGLRLRLSRYVVLRPTEDRFILESSISGRSFPVTSPSVLRLLLALARPARVEDLLECVEASQQPTLLEFLDWCREGGVLTTVGDDERSEEDRSPVAAWEFHDLLFHTRSRRGRNLGQVGASYRLRGVLPPEPLFRNAPVRDRLTLPRPDLARLERDDPPLTRVLEARRSLYSLAPVTIAQLGELLFRTFRVVGVEDLPGDEPVVRKVYPSAGSRHSLELYVVPWTCEGLERGVWHYRAEEHALAPVCGFAPEVKVFLEEARAGTGVLGAYPPVLLIISARFRRVAWKYQAMAYGAILKEVGGVFQTFYLAATAMGLSPCALGAGDSDRFARVVGTDYYRETSVGEFILGGPGGLTGLELAQHIHAGGSRLGAELRNGSSAPGQEGGTA